MKPNRLKRLNLMLSLALVFLCSPFRNVAFCQGVIFSDNFDDGDYTANPSWSVYNNPGCGTLTSFSVQAGALRFSRAGAGGCFGEAFVFYRLNTDISSGARINFDVRVSSRSLPCGGQSGWGEMPAFVWLVLRLVNGDTVNLRYAYCYGSLYPGFPSNDYSDSRTKQFGFGAPQDVWQLGRSFRIQDAWPLATTLIEIRIGGSGWDFESWFDNIAVMATQSGFSDDFNDGNYTVNPRWNLYSYPGCGTFGAATIESGQLRILRSGAGGCFGETYIQRDLNAPISADVMVSFDVKVSSRSVPCGGQSGWGEMPAIVWLVLRLASGDTVNLRYAYCYGDLWPGFVGTNYSDTKWRQYGFSILQNTWFTARTFRIQDAWPTAATILQIRLGGSGWDFESWFDNVSVSPVVVTVEKPTEMPSQYLLLQNYPNPFNPSTMIEYRVPQRGHVELRVYDVLGRVVRTLVSEVKDPGSYSETWHGRNEEGRTVANGVYICELMSGSFLQTRKMIFLK